MGRWSVRLVVAALGVLVCCVVAVHVAAASVTVTLSDDSTNACATSGAAPCSLRDAVAYANANDSTTINFSLPNPSTITLTTNTTLTLSRTTGTGTTITGPGASALSVDGNCTLTNQVCTSGGVTVLTVNPGVTASISGLTIQHGSSSLGGGIINNQSTLTVTNSAISGNFATDSGGGIENFAGTLTVTNSTFSGNSASAAGGGINSSSSGVDAIVTVTNSTFAGNTANLGGAIANAGTLTATNSTFSGNSGTLDGAFIYNIGTATLANTIVANSTGGSCSSSGGTITADSHNLADDNTCGSATQKTSAQINLQPLANNGGSTQTMALGAGSAAIDMGTNTGCPATDQRGAPRPINGICDIGAFEFFSGYATMVNNAGDGAPNTLNCAAGNPNTCRLRDAIAAVNGGATGAIMFDTIAFPASTRTTITLGSTLTLSASMTINGTGHMVVVDGNNAVTVFIVNNGVTATLNALTIQQGNAGGGNGGGILNSGTLTVTNSTLATNTAQSGAGIYNTGTLTLVNSTLIGNSSIGPGGAITNFGPLNVTNSTFTGNSGSFGGGINNFASVTLTNTIVANSTGGDLANSGGNYSGTHNLIDDANSSNSFNDGTNGNIVGHPALLGSLANNGGPTQTFALLTGSPAIAHGDPTTCSQSGAGKVNSLDQRGVTRPTTLCAIGAVEPYLSTISPNAGVIGGGQTVYLTGAGFAAGATVSIGGVACGSVQVMNSTTLQCITGARAAGTVDVVVTQNSQTGALMGAYTYGMLNPLPSGKTSGSPSGSSPGALPASRPTGPSQPTTPNPLPLPRQ